MPGLPLVPDTINSSIDLLKEISSYFSVSIDDLLSGEQLIFIAEKENKSNLNSVCDLLLGFVDLFSLMLIFLPLYPKPVNGYIYSVNLFVYRAQYNCCLVFGYGERAVCDNRNIPVIAYQRHFAL